MSGRSDRFSVIIADDEPMARERIRRLLGTDTGIDIVADCASGADTVAAVGAFAPDLLLLDIQMPEMDGFAVVSAIPEDRLPIVIFVTAFDEHALRAFAVHALDYLLKPIDPERLHEAVARARQLSDRAAAAEQHQRIRATLGVATQSATSVPRIAGAAPSAALDTQPGPQRFLVKTDGRMYFVPSADVDWIEAEGNYVRLHVGGASHMIRETIGALERALPPSRFARIHRSAIVNLDSIAEMRQWASGDYIVILKTGVRLKLSRTYRENVEQRARG